MEQLFTITRLDWKRAREVDSGYKGPHVHDYEELLIGIEGTIEHFIDFRASSITAPFVSFVSQGKAHHLKHTEEDDHSDIWMLSFRSEFIPETTFQLYSYYHDHANIKMQPGKSFTRMVSLCEMMHSEMQEPVPDYSIIRQLLSVLFTMIESERKKLNPGDHNLQKTQNMTFRSFLKILEENYHRSEGVEFYADKLFMSARNLNLICRNILQKSVSEIIETRKLIEAKNLLAHSDKTVSEIGFDLGYNEKAYFTNVFKKRTGQTPTEFRAEMARLLS